jgi:FtsZ-binding cell division protein ZapB
VSKLNRTIASLKQEVDGLKEQNRVLREVNASAEKERGGSRSHSEEVVSVLNKKIVSLEESNASLQTKLSFLQGRYDTLQKISNDRDEENKRIADKLRQLSALNSSDLVRSLTDDNRALSEQVCSILVWCGVA